MSILSGGRGTVAHDSGVVVWRERSVVVQLVQNLLARRRRCITSASSTPNSTKGRVGDAVVFV